MGQEVPPFIYPSFQSARARWAKTAAAKRGDRERERRNLVAVDGALIID